jgi:hypothetical protein
LIAIGTSARRTVVRKELIKAVRTLFDEGLRARLPDFVRYKMVDNGRNCHGSECRWYRWQVALDLSFFAMLKPCMKAGDEFWVYVGWSRTEDHSDVTDDFKQCFNLGKLWNAKAGWYTFRLNEPGYEQIARMTDEEFAHWAENPQEMDRERIEAGLKQAPICVQDAIDRIIAYAIPFFERVRREASSPR